MSHCRSVGLDGRELETAEVGASQSRKGLDLVLAIAQGSRESPAVSNCAQPIHVACVPSMLETQGVMENISSKDRNLNNTSLHLY